MKQSDKNDPFHGMNGKNGDMVYYSLHGKRVARRIGKIDPLLLKEAKQYESLRNNQSEMGFASGTSKTIREGINKQLKYVQDYKISQRLTGVLRLCLNHVSGEKGQRNFTQACLAGLDKFPFSVKYPMSKCIRNSIRIITDLTANKIILNPEGSLDYTAGMCPKPHTAIFGLVFLSPFKYENGYEILYPKWHGQNFSVEIPVEELNNEDGYVMEIENLKDIPKDLLKVGYFGYLSEGGAAGRGWLVGMD